MTDMIVSFSIGLSVNEHSVNMVSRNTLERKSSESQTADRSDSEQP